MITYGALRNAYYGLAARYARGGNMRYVRLGEDGFSFPESVTNNEEAIAFANKYISEHQDLSDEEKADIRAMANSFAGHSVGDTTATGSGVPPRDSIATGAGANQGETVVGSTRAPLQDIERIEIEAPGYEEVLREYIESHPDETGLATMPGLSDEEKYQVFLNHLTPQLIKSAFYDNDNLGFNPNSKKGQEYFSKLKSDWLASDAGKAWSNRMNAENEAGQREMGTRGRIFANMLGDDIEKERLAKAQEAIDKDVAAIDWDEYMKPVEEENLGNEGVTDYNDFYNNASRKDIRGVAHGKGWTKANGEELLWTGDNRKQNRQYARSVRQGRRQDIRNIRNGQPSSVEYRYAPRFERDGGAMMRTFIGAMRRGGRL